MQAHNPLHAMILAACLAALQSAELARPSAPTLPAEPRLELEAIREARDRALHWLAAQQDEQGHWPVLEGEEAHRVGVSSLALRALQAAGNKSDVGPHARAMERGLAWLWDQVDPDSGSVGDAVSHTHHYNHAIATLVLCEELDEQSGALEREVANSAVHYVLRARNPYGAWRYDNPPIGDNDTSITSWMVRALAAAQAKEVPIDRAAFEGASAWVQEVTDAETGRVGYDSTGSMSSRTVQNEHYPRENGEAMTAAGIGILVHAQAWDERDVVAKRQQLRLLRNQPEWEVQEFAVDMYYWFQAAHSLSHVDGEAWRIWAPAMARTVIRAQRTDGEFAGSWDPAGPWGYSGGRVYATALMALSLQKLLDNPRWRSV